MPEQELLALATALARFEPLGVVEACRELLDRGREPSAVLQGLTSLLRDLVLAAVAPDRLELTSFSPQFRPQLPELAQQLGTAKLLQWQSQLKGANSSCAIASSRASGWRCWCWACWPNQPWPPRPQAQAQLQGNRPPRGALRPIPRLADKPPRPNPRARSGTPNPSMAALRQRPMPRPAALPGGPIAKPGP